MSKEYDQYCSNLQEKEEVAKKVNELLNMSGDPLGVLSWWFQPNARIAGTRCPYSELIWGDPKVVLLVAEALTEDSG